MLQNGTLHAIGGLTNSDVCMDSNYVNLTVVEYSMIKYLCKLYKMFSFGSCS